MFTRSFFNSVFFLRPVDTRDFLTQTDWHRKVSDFGGWGGGGGGRKVHKGIYSFHRRGTVNPPEKKKITGPWFFHTWCIFNMYSLESVASFYACFRVLKFRNICWGNSVSIILTSLLIAISLAWHESVTSFHPCFRALKFGITFWGSSLFLFLSISIYLYLSLYLSIYSSVSLSIFFSLYRSLYHFDIYFDSH